MFNLFARNMIYFKFGGNPGFRAHLNFYEMDS